MSGKKNMHLFATAMVLLEFATYASNDMVLPAMPKIIQQFGGTLSHIPLSMSLYILGCAMFQLFVAPLADYYGVKKALLWGSAYFVVSTGLTIVSTSMDGFLFFRLMAGVSMTFSSLGYSVIHSVYNDKQATKVTSLMQNFTVISPILGPMLGVFIIQQFSWHYIFIFSAILGVFSFFGIGRNIPDLPIKKKKLHLGELFLTYAQLFKKRIFVIGVFSCLLAILPYLIWIAFSTTVIKEALMLNDKEYIILQCIALGGSFFSTLGIQFFAGKFSFVGMMILGLSLALVGLGVSLFWSDDIYMIAYGMMCYGLGVGVYNTLSMRIVGTIEFPHSAMIFTLFMFILPVGFFVAITLLEHLFAAMSYRTACLGISNGLMMIGMVLLCPYFIYLNRKKTWN